MILSSIFKYLLQWFIKIKENKRKFIFSVIQSIKLCRFVGKIVIKMCLLANIHAYDNTYANIIYAGIELATSCRQNLITYFAI